MCGRYQLNFSDPNEFRRTFEIVGDYPEDMKPSWNIAPSQTEPIVLSQSPNRVEMMMWGLIPLWEKSDKPKGLINLRDDTILSKKWAHKYLQFQRCIVPATGFYEWKKTSDGKIPYSIRMKDREYFGMAGLYSEWKHPMSSHTLQSYAIITTQANEIMSPIHNRMPVILQSDDQSRWLSHDLVEIEHIADFLKPYSSDEMKAYPVSSRVNSPSFNDSSLINPIPEEEPKPSLNFTPNSK